MPSLSKSGVFQEQPFVLTDLEIDPNESGSIERDELGDKQAVAVLFNSAADGRGFSLAKSYRDAGLTVTLVAKGHLIPDQARLAFQSGFDFIEIDDAVFARHGEMAWRQALQDAVGRTYVFDAVGDNQVSEATKSIWEQRAQATQAA